MSTEKFEFKRNLLVMGNLAILAWIVLASLSFTFINQLYGWMFLLFTAAMVFLIIRRLGCSSCYYCKSCTSGFGRLAGWFFGNRNTKDLNNKAALGFVVFTYFILGPLAIILLTFALTQTFDMLRIVLLSCLVMLSVYSATTWIKPNPRKEPAT